MTKNVLGKLDARCSPKLENIVWPNLKMFSTLYLLVIRNFSRRSSKTTGKGKGYFCLLLFFSVCFF